jgi:tRNA (adenine37-N6)-methyltransferase
VNEITYKSIAFFPIGIIKSPFIEKVGMPIQPAAGKGIKGSVEVFEEFKDGLKDLDGFSHIILIYYLHRSEKYKLCVKPFLDDQERGVFATRAPNRPNAIGMSVVRLLEINGNQLTIENVDILDKTPLLDIKPYISAFDCFETESNGWISGKTINLTSIRSDDRFINK